MYVILPPGYSSTSPRSNEWSVGFYVEGVFLHTATTVTPNAAARLVNTLNGGAPYSETMEVHFVK